MTALRKVLKRQMTIAELRHHLGKYSVTMARALFSSNIARGVIMFLALVCIFYPLWRFTVALQSDVILFSVPLYFFFVLGAILFKAALIWGRRGES